MRTSSRETAATYQLLALLEARYAIRVLWALRDGHPQTFRLLQDSVGGITPNTLNTRIKEMREAGLMQHNGDGYSVRRAGRTCSALMTCRPRANGRRPARKSRLMKLLNATMPADAAGPSRRLAWVEGPGAVLVKVEGDKLVTVAPAATSSA